MLWTANWRLTVCLVNQELSMCMYSLLLEQLTSVELYSRPAAGPTSLIRHLAGRSVSCSEHVLFLSFCVAFSSVSVLLFSFICSVFAVCWHWRHGKLSPSVALLVSILCFFTFPLTLFVCILCCLILLVLLWQFITFQSVYVSLCRWVLWHCCLDNLKGVWSVTMMVVTSWLELCVSYSSSCRQHRHHP